MSMRDNNFDTSEEEEDQRQRNVIARSRQRERVPVAAAVHHPRGVIRRRRRRPRRRCRLMIETFDRVIIFRAHVFHVLPDIQSSVPDQMSIAAEP
eukprot:1006115-Karenia_brevis.AAC.1